MSGRERKRKRGQRKPLTSHQQDLAERYLPLARSLAKPLKERWPSEWEEFESAALMAIVEAAESFDAGRNVRFSTFARMRITGALRDVLRRMAHAKRQVDESHSVQGGKDVAAIEDYGKVINTAPDAEVGADLEQSDAVEAWLRKLPDKHAQACREIYVNGCSQVEAARRMGVSQSRLSYLRREAISMLNGTWDMGEWKKVTPSTPEPSGSGDER